MSNYPNPWLAIPLEDYEAHMACPSVGQYAILAELFAEALAFCLPRSVAILGVAGGNGLERIDPSHTKRVCGIDINPSYLKATHSRFGSRLNLELYCEDLAAGEVEYGQFELSHAALIFEHAGMGLCLVNAIRMTADGGHLSVVLQLAAAGDQPDVSSTTIRSMEALKQSFRLVEPDRLRTCLLQHSFIEVREARRVLPGGKAFWMGIFLRR